MRDCCKNRLSIHYTCRDAIEDLQLAIRAAEAQRNKEEPRRGRSPWDISRKW